MTQDIANENEKIKNTENGKPKNKKPINKDLIFYSLLMIWPVLQFAVFYVGVNANSVLMAFQKISYVDPSAVGANGGSTVSVPTLEQFGKVFKWFSGYEFRAIMGVSVKFYLYTLIISVPLGLLFSYYIYKKFAGWSVFRAMLFLPSILSGVVMGAIYKFFCDSGVTEIISKITNDKTVLSILDVNSGKTFFAMLFFNLWISFGTTVLMYSNKMSGLDQEIVEAAHIDGATGIKEFWHITMPYVYPTFSVFFITGFAQICSNQYNLYNIYGGSGMDPAVRNMGYYLFTEVSGKFSVGGLPELPYYSAMSVIITLVAVPVTFGVKWAVEKFGPSED